MASFGIYIPDGSELEKKIKLKADRFHDGKVSAYVRKCVEKDISETQAIAANTSLVDLARQFRPALANRLDSYNLDDQALILDRFLEAFAEAMTRKDFKPKEPFVIANSLDALRIAIGSAEFFRRIATIAQGGDAAATDKMLSATFPQWQDMQDLIAAEDPAKYGQNTPEAPVIQALKKLPTHSAHKSTPTPR